MELFNINGLNFKGAVQKESKKTEDAIYELKQTDISSFEALDSMGRAQINIKLPEQNPDNPIPYETKVLMADKAGITDKNELRVLFELKDKDFLNALAHYNKNGLKPSDYNSLACSAFHPKTKEEIDQISELIQSGVQYYFVNDFSLDEVAKANRLIKKGLSPNIATTAAKNEDFEAEIITVLDDKTIQDEKKEKLLDLYNTIFHEKGVSNIADIANLCLELNMSDGYEIRSVNLEKLNPETAKKIHGYGISGYNSVTYAQNIPEKRLNDIYFELSNDDTLVSEKLFQTAHVTADKSDEKWQKALEFAKTKMYTRDIGYATGLNPDIPEEKRMIELLKAGAEYSGNLTFAAQEGGKRYEKILNWMKAGVPFNSADYYSDRENGDEIISYALENEIDPFAAENILNVEDKETALKLYKEGRKIKTAVDFAQRKDIDEDKLSFAAKLADENIEGCAEIVKDEGEFELIKFFLDNYIYIENFHKLYKESPEKIRFAKNITEYDIKNKKDNKGPNSTIRLSGVLPLALKNKEFKDTDIIKAEALIDIGIDAGGLAHILSNKNCSVILDWMLNNPEKNKDNKEVFDFAYALADNRLNLKELDRVFKLKAQNLLNDKDIIKFALEKIEDEEEFERAAVFYAGVNNSEFAETLAKLKDENGRLLPLSVAKLEPDSYSFNELKEFLNEGILSEDLIQKAYEFKKRGLNFVDSILFGLLDIKEKDKAAELRKRGINIANIQEILQKGDYTKAIQAADKKELDKYMNEAGLKASYVSNKDIIRFILLSKQYDISLNNIIKIQDKLFGDEEEIFPFAINELKNGETDVDTIIDNARKNYKKNKENEYIEKGLSPEDASYMANSFISHDKKDEIVNFAVNYNVSVQFAIEIIQDDDAKRRFFNLTEQKHIPPKTAQIIAAFAGNNNFDKNNASSDESFVEFVNNITDEEFVKKIQKKTGNPNLNAALERIFDKALNNPYVCKNLINSNLSSDEIIDLTANFAKKSLKLAMKRPNLYLSNIPVKLTTKVDGKYPVLEGEELEKYQNEFLDFCANNLYGILRMQKYFDSDTFNQLMDKRTNNFGMEIDKLNELTDKNLGLVSDLIRLKNVNGKPLTAKEKIQLAEIVVTMQRTKMNPDELKKLEKIDVAGLKKKLLCDGLKNQGLSETEIKKIPEEKLDFDGEYSWVLLSSQLKGQFDYIDATVKTNGKAMIAQYKEMLKNEEMYGHYGVTREFLEKIIDLIEGYNERTKDENFKLFNEIYLLLPNNVDELPGVIKGAVSGDFKEYISDENNKYGKMNAQTKKEFEKHGINYDIWFQSDREDDIELNINGKDYTVGMWERYPQKDLFMGDRTSCCTAISDGANGKSTPLYLLNSAFNVVELKDEKNNIVGMSRIYMGEIDNKAALIMDNIEINAAFKKNLSEKELKQTRDAFFEYMKNYADKITEKNDTPVYFSTSYTGVPMEDLKTVIKTVDFIGSLSNENFYSNTAKNWIKPEELKNEERTFYVIN